MITYRDFIEELRPLVEQAQSLSDLSARTDAPQFRKWRHEVTDLIGNIENAGYAINCRIDTRNFDEHGSYSYYPTERDRAAAYNRDLEDSIIELKTVISSFEKFGDPKAPLQQQPAQQPLKMPEKITAAWLWANAPVSLWLSTAGIAAAVFAAGVALGQSPIYSEVIGKLESSKPMAAKTP